MKQPQPEQSSRTDSTERFQCPTCKRPFIREPHAKADQRKSFPFCSERCKLIDLGAWLDAEYRIPSQPDADSDETLDTGFDAAGMGL